MSESSKFPFSRDASNSRIRWESDSKFDFRKGELLSQVWQGSPWNHSILLHRGFGKACVLNISGDFVEDADTRDFSHLVSHTLLPTAMLFGVPNQPLYERREDDLIAHTFEQWLDSGNDEDLLLVPMVRSVLAAMDVLQSEFGFERFVLTGASKRGWTTWLAALTNDPRIIGIAPMVFDNLNFQAQMQNQLDLWGDFSPKLEDYSVRGLPNLLSHPHGEALARRVDPFHHLDRLKVPVLIINGANDEFWAVNALSHYWDDIPARKHALVIPNVGHDLGNRKTAYTTLGHFARSLEGDADFPVLKSSVSESRGVIESSLSVTEWRLFSNESANGIFAGGQWREMREPLSDSHYAEFVRPEPTREMPFKAVLASAEFDFGDGQFSLSTPIFLQRWQD